MPEADAKRVQRNSSRTPTFVRWDRCLRYWVAAKSKGKSEHLTIDGRDVPLSNLEKVLYPETGFTKGQVIDFYIRVSAFLLPHFKDRPVTLKRYPDGVQGEFFYEKDEPSFAPKWI